MKYFRVVLCLVAIATADDINVQETPDSTETGKRNYNPAPDEVQLQCRTNSMCIGFSRAWLEKQWGVAEVEQLSLAQRCDSPVVANETHIVLCTEDGKMTSCGTKFTQNDTHVTFSNNVHILLKSDEAETHSLTPTVKASIPWVCTYPMQLLVGVEFAPQISPVTVFIGNKTGYGKFEAAMFLFQDEFFQRPYDSTPHLDITDRLRVKVQLLQGPENSRVQIVRCWGTPVADPDHEDISYTLIDDYCPSPEGKSANVRMRNNGDHQHALWESNVFRFVASPQVYIHCHVKVCFSGVECEKKCTSSSLLRRKRRDLGGGEGLLSLGPLRVAEAVPGLKDAAKDSSEAAVDNEANMAAESQNDAKKSLILGMPRTAVYVMIGGLGLICVVLTTTVIAVLLLRSKKRQAKTNQYWQSQAAARSRLSPRFTLSNAPPFEIPLTVPNTIANPSRRDSLPTQ